MKDPLASKDYRVLAELRYQIRQFMRFSERAAHAAGLEPHQHQFMLALKGLPTNVRPLVGELAKRLQIQQHSAVELANRLEAGGYIHRLRSEADRREVLLVLTPKGEKVLQKLTLSHRSELRERGPALVAALTSAMRASDPHSARKDKILLRRAQV